MKNPCKSFSLILTAMSFLVFGRVVPHAIANDPIDCSTPTGTFPISSTGSPVWCDGHSGVHFDVDEPGVRSNYRWEVHSNFGSVCWNGLQIPYTVNGLWPNDPFNDPTAPPSSTTSTGNNGPWQGYLDPCRPVMDTGFPINPPFGFRAPLHLLATPGLGDFLPPSPTLEGSSAALIPGGGGQSSTWWNDATRQTLHQAVDLVTGLPLARVQELELPFDGATFRLIRTRSGNRYDQVRLGDGWYDAIAATDRWWDHAGQGWMISENPVLIVDSAVADLVGNNPRTTWLVLDAHHSIPFQQIESTGVYAAPPRFRAKLAHNGNWTADPNTGKMGWAEGQEPTQMDVYLYDGALKYSFVIVREDVPHYFWDKFPALGISATWGSFPSNLNDRPFLSDQFPSGSDNYKWWDPFAHCMNPGMGLPYLGLCVSIEDNYGHQVEINYCNIVQQAVPYEDETVGGTDGSACMECGQACTRKGMIRSVNLKTRGQTRWSLLYAYRGFRGHNVTVTQDFVADATTEAGRRFREQDLWGMYQIDRIYVYKVADGQSTPEQQIASLHADYLASGLTVDHTKPLDLHGNGADPLAELLGTTGGLADGWMHLVQYHYIKKLDENNTEYGVWNGGMKVMTSVTSRTEPATGSPAESIKRWVFHHTHGSGSAQPFAGPISESGYEHKLGWLSRIYTPDDVAKVLSATNLQLGGPLTVENLVRMTKPGTTVPLSLQQLDIDGDNLVDHSEMQRVANFASYQFGSGDHDWQRWPNTDGRSDAPNATKLLSRGYLVNDASRLMTDMHYDVAGSLIITDENGQRRYYQINRLRVSPTNFLWTDNDPFRLHWFGIGEEFNHRSAFVHPYQWHGYMPNYDAGGGWLDPSTSQPPSLMDVRWITIIDEFGDLGDLVPTGRHIADGYGVYGGEHAIKKSQLSRRVVELSPSGYLLRERKWEYSEDGVVRSGGGIGEQYIYKTVEDYFADLNDPLPADTTEPTPGSSGGPSGAIANDGLTNLRRELLTVERRSIGWSVAELDPLLDETTTGLVSITKYAAFHPSNEVWADYDDVSESLIPAASRVQAVAEGFHRGTNYVTPTGSTGWEYQSNGNPIFFTTQWIRDPVLPNDVTAEVAFVQPTTALLSSLPTAVYSQPPPVSYRVQRTFIERDDSDVSVPEEERPILSRMIVGVPKQVYPGSPWYYPVEREFYDEDGNPAWSCTGQLKDPEDPAGSAGTDPYESLTFTFYKRDREGRSLHTVLDAAPGSAVSSIDGQTGITIPAWPESGWARIGAGEPLRHVTSFEYDTYAPGLCDIYFPSGRRWARRVVILEDTAEGSDYNAYLDEFAREFIYNDLEKVNGVWVTRSDGEVKDYRSTNVFQSPLVTRKVRFVGDLPYNSGSLAVTESSQPEWYLKSAIRLGVDGNGRIQQASLLERSPSGALLAVGSKMINDLGELYREQEIDETITVQTRNSLGQTLRVYQGTEDRRWYVPTSQQGNYPQINMVLLERTEYGSGVNDVWQPTVVRHYERNQPWVQDLHGEVLPENDVYGRATVIRYDWLGRPVRTDQYERGNPADARRLSTTIVYLDYLSRPYLEVTYGADPEDPNATQGWLVIPTAIDPAAFVDAAGFPELIGVGYDLSLFFAGSTGQRPLSLTQSIYGLDGGLEERRSYDIGWNGSGTAPYHAEYTYSTRGGNPSFVQSPGGQVEITRLDSLGRVASTITAIPSRGAFGTTNIPNLLKQLTRTDLRYDTDGNVIETAFWERVKDSGTELDGTNTVRTRTLNWYNPHKRLIATADLGTESQHGYRFESSTYAHEVPGPGDNVNEFDVPYWDESTSTVLGLGTLPASAMVSIYQYDDSGNKVRSVDPRGIVTEYEYSSANKLLYKTENAGGSPARMSGYRYEYGRLIEMNLVTADNRISPIGGSAPPVMGDVSPAGSAGLTDLQVYGDIEFAHRTRLRYGGEIVVQSGLNYIVVSQNNKLIRSMHLPNEQTGDPADDADVFLRYTFSGQIAERYNSAGEAFRYFYDDLGRLREIEAGRWDPSDGYPQVFIPIDPMPIGGSGLPTPTDKIGFIEYTYDDRGNLSDIRAWTERDEQDRILISHNRVDYARDHMVTEWQSHGEAVGSGTPRVEYVWEYEATNTGITGTNTARTGHHRLTTMRYPVPNSTTPRRVLTMQYGADGSETDLLSRLTRIRSSFGSQILADFTHSGAGRRSSLLLKNGKVVNDLRDPAHVGLAGVDIFGRTTRTLFLGTDGTTTPTATLYDARSGLNTAGNRTHARITQAPVGGQSRDNIRSVLNTYDSLDRLVGSRFGELVDSGGVMSIASGTQVHEDAWTLDLLGNWVGQTNPSTGEVIAHGRTTSGQLDDFGVPWSLSTYAQYAEYVFGVSHTVDHRDSIVSLGLFEMYDGDAQTAEQRAVSPVYDGAGRLMFDGEYVYQYDHWGRLVQVNRADYDPQDPPVDPADVILSASGPMLKHYVYDGLGRLIRTTSPVPDPDTTAGATRAVHFYYDGARRVQEIRAADVLNYQAAQSSGDPGLESLASGSTNEGTPDGSNTPLSLQIGQLEPVPFSRNIHREYVWGPGDNGFDEILLQTDALDDEYWCLQDGGGDLVALVTVTGNDATVVRQWTYDAYGAVLTAEHLGAALESHIGHKGLFVERLDVGVGEASDPESPRLVPHGHAIYHNRNRSYVPVHGRFLQPDPNQTAMALLSVTAAHGRGMGSIAIAFSMEGMYGDGLNLYQYLGSNPWTRFDPLGLSWDDEIDALIDELIGGRAAALSQLGKDMEATAIVAARIASLLPIPMAGVAGDLALYALGDQNEQQLAAALALGVIPGGKLAGKLFKSMGGMASSAFSAASQMARAGGTALLQKAGGLASRARTLVRRKPGSACGCFTAMTMVWTAQGMVPISEIEQGQYVYAAAEDALASDYASGEVGATIYIGEASLVRLTVRHADGSVEIINTTDEHPFHPVHTGEWTRADRLQVGDQLSTMAGTAELLAVEYGTARVPVYNLSIPGSPTYFVGTHGLWVHNCSKYAIRNQHLAGKNHPITGVPFDALGYPRFNHQGQVILPNGHAGRAKDFREADSMFGINEEFRRKNNLTWHHHQDGNTMQLVDSSIHRQTGHTGSLPGP